MIDEPTLQKLVDGELDNQQIRALLRDADSGADSAAWKQLAVAYAENQMFQRGFAEFDTGLVPQTQQTPAVDQTIGRQQPEDKTQFNHSGTFWKLALAAVLLIGVSIGLQQWQGQTPSGISQPGTSVASNSQQLDSQQPDSQPSSHPETPVKLKSFDHDTLLTLKPDLQLKSALLPPEINSRVKQQVPLYSDKRFDRQQLSDLRSNDVEKQRALLSRMLPPTRINAELKSNYEKAGLLVDHDIEFLSGRLDDGRAYMIPYRTVRMSSVQ